MLHSSQFCTARLPRVWRSLPGCCMCLPSRILLSVRLRWRFRPCSAGGTAQPLLSCIISITISSSIIWRARKIRTLNSVVAPTSSHRVSISCFPMILNLVCGRYLRHDCGNVAATARWPIISNDFCANWRSAGGAAAVCCCGT